MSGPESLPPDDRLLAEFLAGQGAVREIYRTMAQEQVPPHLDAAVLQAAESAAASSTSRPRRRHWQTPMAAAAVMVLSFGVFLQVQRDPAAQSQLVEAPKQPSPSAVPTAVETSQDAAKNEVLAEAASARKEVEADKNQVAATVAKPRAVAIPQSRRVAAADDTPPPPAPPPALATAAEPPPSATLDSFEPERAEKAADHAALSAAAARESRQQQETFAAAAGPMAKARGVPRAANLLDPHMAPTTIVSETSAAAAIERWAQSCDAASIGLVGPMRWRGLEVVAWRQQLDDQQVVTALRFAPEITREAIAAALGSLAAKTSLTAAHCAHTVLRELRASEAGWSLTCECASP